MGRGERGAGGIKVGGGLVGRGAGGARLVFAEGAPVGERMSGRAKTDSLGLTSPDSSKDPA